MPTTPKRALIIGIDGQDGAYLAKHLLGNGDWVGGTWFDREAWARNFGILGLDGLDTERFALPAGIDAWRGLLERFRPDEIYFLAGISSVGMSFQVPSATLATTVVSVCELLECLRKHAAATRLFYAGSVECFGGTRPDEPASDENTPFRPAGSPYAVGKAAAMELIRMYRAAYGMYVCSGILSNHESPLRPPSFVTRKVVDAALAIKAGRADRLELGNLDVRRDWGWAEEFVRAYPLMLRCGEPNDFVIATGKTRGLREFVALAFDRAGLGDYRRYVSETRANLRAADAREIRVDPSLSARVLGWEAKTGLEGIVEKMLAIKDLSRPRPAE